jgi:mono/diheme cytochrome c family protein
VPRFRVSAARAALTIAIALTGAACATSRAPVPADQAAGREFVERACAGCHATARAGASRNADAPPFRDLARSRSDRELAAALADISRNGHIEMPPIYVTPAEQKQVIAYLRTLRDQVGTGGSPAPALRGRDFAVSRCSGCHAVGLKGVSPYRAAPPFRSLAQAWSPIALQLRLERSPLHDGPDMPSRQLSGGQADDLAAYIQTLQAGHDLGRPGYTGPICTPTYWC